MVILSLMVTSCAERTTRDAVDDPSEVMVGAAFKREARDLVEQFSFGSSAAAVVEIRESKGLSDVAPDGARAFTTRVQVDVVRSIYGLDVKEMTLVLPGAAIDGTSFIYEGLPSSSDLGPPGSQLLVFLSPEVDKLRPVEAMYPVVDESVMSGSGQAMAKVADLDSLWKAGTELRSTIVAARPFDDKFAVILDEICSRHSTALRANSKAIAEALNTPGIDVVALVTSGRELLSDLVNELANLNPPEGVSSSVQQSWIEVSKGLSEGASIPQLLDASSAQRVILLGQALESNLQAIGAGNCVGFAS